MQIHANPCNQPYPRKREQAALPLRHQMYLELGHIGPGDCPSRETLPANDDRVLGLAIGPMVALHLIACIRGQKPHHSPIFGSIAITVQYLRKSGTNADRTGAGCDAKCVSSASYEHYGGLQISTSDCGERERGREKKLGFLWGQRTPCLSLPEGPIDINPTTISSGMAHADEFPTCFSLSAGTL
jgi:hypothetical protein